jgi:hypothetical protein
LLRSEASRLLDIGTSELTVGYSVRRTELREQVEAFLADSLDNGAGYCSHLGQLGVFSELMNNAEIRVKELAQNAHNSCDSSCPDCLRDYSNLMYHPLLDWRLGRDLLDLHSGRGIDTSLWYESERQLAVAFADEFYGSARELDGGVWAIEAPNKTLVIRHPLEAPTDRRDPEGLELTERMDRAFVDAELIGKSVAFASSFDLQRRPGWVLAHEL